jgi:hypothetical protein
MDSAAFYCSLLFFKGGNIDIYRGECRRNVESTKSFTSLPPKKTTEPVFLNVYGAQESIPRDEFRQPM